MNELKLTKVENRDECLALTIGEGKVYVFQATKFFMLFEHADPLKQLEDGMEAKLMKIALQELPNIKAGKYVIHTDVVEDLHRRQGNHTAKMREYMREKHRQLKAKKTTS